MNESQSEHVLSRLEATLAPLVTKASFLGTVFTIVGRGKKDRHGPRSSSESMCCCVRFESREPRIVDTKTLTFAWFYSDICLDMSVSHMSLPRSVTEWISHLRD